MKTIGRVLYAFMEYGLGLIFVYLGYLEFTASVLTGTALHLLLGGEIALVIYGTWFTILGILLIVANVMGWVRCRKLILLIMYLTAIYLSILNMVLFGFTMLVVDDLAVGLWAATLWMKLKLKSDYVRIKDL